MSAQLHVVPHTHWDREWFVPSGFAREWLVPFFASLLQRFNDVPGYRFVLDGQTVLVEDFIAQIEPTEVPGFLSVLKRVVESGGLSVGPYYQQPDWQLASGEALIRNLLIGTDDAAALGGSAPVGWLMDNFGQIAQCVQIHSGFGINGILGWRGFDLLPDRLRSELIWESPDGTRLPLVYLIDSYRNGMRIFSNPVFLERRREDIKERIEPFSTDGNLLVMNGYDQEMEPEVPVSVSPSGDLPMRLSSAVEFLKAKARAFAQNPLVVRGSQYSGRFISVFPGILSARNYLKVANDRAQAMQERYIDPLVAVAAICGSNGDTSVVEAFRNEVELLWRLILLNHPHDTICGVGSDPVHEEAELRLADIHERQERLLERITEFLGFVVSDRPTTNVETGRAGVNGSDDVPVVFNPSLYARSVLVDGYLTEPVPPLTAEAAVVRKENRERSGAEGPLSYHIESGPDGAKRVVLESGTVRCVIDSDGTLSIGPGAVKNGGRQAEPYTVRWRFSTDVGDTYSFDLAEGTAPRLVRIESSSLVLEPDPEGTNEMDVATVSLTGVLKLPESAEAAVRSGTATETTTATVENPVTLTVQLRREESFIRISAEVDSVSRDYRLQMVFSFGQPYEMRVLNQFYWDDPLSYRRSFTADRLGDAPPEVSRLMLGAREPHPPEFVPSDRAFAFGGADSALLVCHRGLHEVEPLTDGVAATVVRAVGRLAGDDLASRTGDAGPDIFTPGAQCHRPIEVECTLGILDSISETGTARTVRMVEESLYPLIVIGKTRPSLKSRSRSFGIPEDGLYHAPEELPVFLSTVKVREDGHGALIRIWNATGDRCPLRWSGPVVQMRLDEREHPDQDGTAQEVILPGFGIATVSPETLTPVGGFPGLYNRRNRPAAERFATPLPYKRFSIPSFRLSTRAWSSLRTVSLPHRRDVGAPVQLLEPSSHDQGYLEEGLRKELERRDRLKSQADAAERTLAAIAADDPTMERTATIQAKSHLSTLRRRLLEAELSVLFTQRLLGTIYHDRLYHRIREVALALNHARVEKRTDDYLAALR